MKKSTAVILCCGVALLGLLLCLVTLFIPKKEEQLPPVVSPPPVEESSVPDEPISDAPITETTESTEPSPIPNVDPEIDISALPNPAIIWDVDIPDEFGDFFMSEEATEAITSAYPGAKDIVVIGCSGNPDFSINLEVENSTSSIVFYASGNGEYSSPVMINNSGTDYAPIIFTNGVPNNADDIYEKSLEYGVFTNFIYYTDYTEGSTVILTSNIGTTVTIEL